MVEINGKVYRNLQEQVEKNKEDIEDINYTLLQDGEAISDLQEAMPYKQDKLTAGDNITIENNVISATGGGSEYTAGDGINISDENTITVDMTYINENVDAPTYSGGVSINIDDNNAINLVLANGSNMDIGTQTVGGKLQYVIAANSEPYYDYLKSDGIRSYSDLQVDNGFKLYKDFEDDDNPESYKIYSPTNYDGNLAIMASQDDNNHPDDTQILVNPHHIIIEANDYNHGDNDDTWNGQLYITDTKVELRATKDDDHYAYKSVEANQIWDYNKGGTSNNSWYNSCYTDNQGHYAYYNYADNTYSTNTTFGIYNYPYAYYTRTEGNVTKTGMWRINQNGIESTAGSNTLLLTDAGLTYNTVRVATVSDIPTNYVTDNTAQTITGQKTFTDNTYFVDNKKLSFYNTDVSTYTKKVEVRSDSIIYTTSGTDKYRIKMIQGGYEQNYYFPLPDSNTGKTIALVDDFKRYFIAVDNGTSTVNIPITTFDKLTTGSSTYANIYKYLGNYMFAVEDHSLTEMNGEINSVTSSGFTFYYRDDNGQQQSINFTSTDSVTIGQ